MAADKHRNDRSLPHSSTPAIRRLLFLVWACFLLRALFYSVLFPMWEGYDEYAHFAFVQHLTVNGELPVASRTRISREIEESLTLAPLPWTRRGLNLTHTTHDEYWKLSGAERREREARLRSIAPSWGAEPASRDLFIYEAQQPPLYYWWFSGPLRLASRFSLAGRVFFLRLLSAGLASLLIPLGFMAAASVLRDRRAALGVASLSAIMPGLMVDVCRVGNDSLSILLYSLLLCAALRFVDNPLDKGSAALLAVSLGLGLLTKAYFLTALPALGLVFLCGSCLRSSGGRRLAVRGSAVLLAALLISGWWYWRSHMLTGSWSSLMQAAALREMSLWDLLRQVPQVDWMNALDTLFFSHIWFGNWSFLQVRYWIYHVFRYIALLSFLGLIVLVGSAHTRYSRPSSLLPSGKHLFLLGALYVFFWLGLLYHVLITFVAGGVSSSAGWYLYCVIAVEILLVVAGLFALLPVGARRWVLPAATVSFGLLDAYTVHFLLVPYYIGLIAHKASGVLGTFVVSQIRDLPFKEILLRLQTNKPFMSSPLLILIWIGYLSATSVLAVLSFRLCYPRPAVASPPEKSVCEGQSFWARKLHEAGLRMRKHERKGAAGG